MEPIPSSLPLLTTTRARTALVWLLPGSLLLLVFTTNNYGPDLWYHLFLGQRIIETGEFQPSDFLIREMPGYLNLYWLFQLILRGLWAIGDFYGIWFGHLVVVLAMAWLWARSARVFEYPGIGLFLSIAAILTWQLRSEVRPDMVSFLGVACLVYALTSFDFAKPLRAWQWGFLFLTEWVWANCHGYFPLGVGLVGLRWAASLAERSCVACERKQLFLALIGVAAATLVNPFTFRVWTHVLHMFAFQHRIGDEIGEFAPTYHVLAVRDWTVGVFWMLWVLTLACLPLLYKRKPALFEATLALCGLYLSAAHYRNTPLLSLLAAPSWANALVCLSNRTSGRFLRLNPISIAVTLVVVATLDYAVVSGRFFEARFSEVSFGLAPSSNAVPHEFVQFAHANPFPGKIFNHTSDGSYLEFFARDLKIYADSRFTDYASTMTVFEAARDPEAFERLHARYQFDGVLLRVILNPLVVHHLLGNNQWELVYADLNRAFFVNQNSPVGRGYSARQMRFYNGQDMTRGDNGLRSQQWANFLLGQHKYELFRQFFTQVSAANKIHPAVLRAAIFFCRDQNDRDLIWRVKELRQRMIEDGSAEQRFVDDMIESDFKAVFSG
jgi:hypothetical protein